MGNVVVTEFVSLDGVFEDPGGAENFEHGGWSFQFDRGADGDRFKLDELNTADAQLLGRVTYEAFAQAWPSITDEVGFAVRMNEMPKSVVSATLTDPTWQNTTVIADDVGGQVRRAVGPWPAGRGSDRRIPPDGLPDRPRQRPPTLRRRHHDNAAGADRVPAGRARRGHRPDLRSGPHPLLMPGRGGIPCRYSRFDRRPN